VVVRAVPNPTPKPLGPTDAALVVAARAGEAWAQEALFRRYARMVNGLAFRMLGRDADVDDLVQDSFLEAFKSLHRLDNPAVFGSWLGSIVVRTASKRLRKRSLLNRLGLRRATPIDADSVISSRASPEINAELTALYGALDPMHPEARVALVLYRVEGMTLPEVAEAMGISLSTAKRRLATADKVLAELGANEEAAP
jgi:RNA polymerase sigma-70 factor (ECF subfamily)